MSRWSYHNAPTATEKKYGLRSTDNDREDGRVLADGYKRRRALEEYQETESEPGSLFDRRR